MARMLNDKPCEVTFFDRISDSKITLSYRLPTTEERVKYANSLIRRRGNKIENTTGDARLKYGAVILLGISDGSFETEKGPLSSDPQSPQYDPDWKNAVKKYAADVIEMLAVHVFEASLIGGEAGDDTDEEEVKEPEKNVL